MTKTMPDHARLRLIALVEGVSLLTLLVVAMPLKHWFGMPRATTIVGSFHGVAFRGYVIAVLDALGTGSLSRRQAALAMVAALIPGGTLVFWRAIPGSAP